MGGFVDMIYLLTAIGIDGWMDRERDREREREMEKLLFLCEYLNYYF